MPSSTIIYLLSIIFTHFVARVELANPPQPIGYLDYASSALASGWACDRSSYAASVTVTILVDNQVVGSIVANLPREAAVGALCGGISNRGFQFSFPQNVVNLLNNGQPHSVSAEVASIPLTNSPINLPAVAPSVPPTPTVLPSIPVGTLEQVNLDFFSGWACDPLRPDVSLQVIIVIDGNAVGSVVANIGRETAVAVQCGQNSFHGFEFPIPQHIRSFLMFGTHQIAAYVTPANGGNLVQLNGSPRPFNNGFP